MEAICFEISLSKSAAHEWALWKDQRNESQTSTLLGHRSQTSLASFPYDCASSQTIPKVLDDTSKIRSVE